MMSESVYKVALGMIPQVTASLVREMAAHDIDPEMFFKENPDTVTDILRLKRGAITERSKWDALERAKSEIKDIERFGINTFFLLDDNYPKRLSQAHDAPVTFFTIGDADLDASKILSVVGTRIPTPYGVDFVRKLCKDLAGLIPGTLVVSGLAFGIDASAHQGALDNGLPTVAVLAHGLGMVYPAAHRDLAKRIIRSGGCLMSEYPTHEKPFRQRFLERNRIIAALSDVTAVIESKERGGSLSTARSAFSYSREVMAVPGRVNDELSAGCLELVKKYRATLLTSALDMLAVMGWKPTNIDVPPSVPTLFPELEGDTKTVYDLLKRNGEPMQMDAIGVQTGIRAGSLAAVLGEMEFDGLVLRHPGNRYSAI